MNNRTDHQDQTGPARERGLDLVDQLPAELLHPQNERPSVYLGQTKPRRRDIAMLLLPGPDWSFTPMAMVDMTRLDVHQKSRGHMLTILIPRPGWRYEVITTEKMRRLELIRIQPY